MEMYYEPTGEFRVPRDDDYFMYHDDFASQSNGKFNRIPENHVVRPGQVRTDVYDEHEFRVIVRPIAPPQFKATGEHRKLEPGEYGLLSGRAGYDYVSSTHVYQAHRRSSARVPVYVPDEDR